MQSPLLQLSFLVDNCSSVGKAEVEHLPRFRLERAG